ncbi:MAG: hypothetical protein M5U09_28195 [Gammaproteobacteria bacterium]|nr:hypothetical protein [Gammaproteobacteria bacterium]
MWQSYEGGWIDFQVVPLADTTLEVRGDSLVATLSSNLVTPRPRRWNWPAGPRQ